MRRNVDASSRAEAGKWVVSVGGDIDILQSDSMIALSADKPDTADKGQRAKVYKEFLFCIIVKKGWKHL